MATNHDLYQTQISVNLSDAETDKSIEARC